MANLLGEYFYCYCFYCPNGQAINLFKKSKYQFNTAYFWFNSILATAQNLLKASRCQALY